MADPKMPEKLGRYEIVRELGKGAMGVVYEGKDPNIGRRVAIKTARREVVEASGMADEMMERFLREAQAAGALNHPNIITIYDAAEEEGIAYIAMEYLEGGDLGDIIDAKKKLGMEEIVEIGANICEALDVAHAHGVVHRDIKPANILMPTDKPLKVADFGIAHVSDSNLTQDGALIGTPHYMSPEQFMGQKLDGRSDLFSVGNILYELTTGEKPFAGEALSTVMHKVIKTDPVNPVELNVSVPDALAQVIMKALSKRPAQRYKTGNEMAAALRESTKENPNPAMLDPGTAIAMGATVAGAPPPSAGPGPAATLPGGPPSEDLVSTLPGNRTGSQETTIADTGPGATVAGAGAGPGGAPPSATMPGNPPASATAGIKLAAADGAMTAGEPMAPIAKGPNKGLLIGGGAAALLVVVIGGIMLAGGGKGEENPTGSGTGAATNTATVQDPVSSLPDKYYADVQVLLFQAKSEDIYKQYVPGQVSRGELDGKVQDVSGKIRMEILDEDDQVVGSNADWDSGDPIDLAPADGAKELHWKASLYPTENPNDVKQRTGLIPVPATAGATAIVEDLMPPPGP